MCEATAYDVRRDRPCARATAWMFPAHQDGPAQDGEPRPHSPADGVPKPPPASWSGGYLDAVDWRWITRRRHRARARGVVWMRPTVGLVEGEPMSPVQRLMTCVDSASGVSAALDPGEWNFLNTELTVHVLRPPVGEWVCLEAETSLGSGSVGRRHLPGVRRPRPRRALGAGAAGRPPLRSSEGPGGDEVADPERVVAVGHRRGRRRPAARRDRTRAAAARCCRAPSAPRRGRRRGRAGRPRRPPASAAATASSNPNARSSRYPGAFSPRRALPSPSTSSTVPSGRSPSSLGQRRHRTGAGVPPRRDQLDRAVPAGLLEQPPPDRPGDVGRPRAGRVRARRTEAADVDGGVRGPVAVLVVAADDHHRGRRRPAAERTAATAAARRAATGSWAPPSSRSSSGGCGSSTAAEITGDSKRAVGAGSGEPAHDPRGGRVPRMLATMSSTCRVCATSCTR